VKKALIISILTLAFLNGKAQTGIGTIAPINKLEVVTTKADPSTSGATANGNLRLGATSNNHVLDFGLSSSSTYSWIQARDKSNYASNYILSLNPNGGYVGINKINPSKSLDVNGDIALSGSLIGANTATSKLSGFVSNTSPEASSRTLAVTDNGMILKCTAGITLILPTAGTLPEGFNCMVLQYGTGQVTFSGTYNNRNNFTKTAGQYSIATILYIGGIYIISGEMSN
jgi:hypothetical protein